MKVALFPVIIAIIAGCANTQSVDEFVTARTSGNFSDQGAIAFLDNDYRFTVILVKDLEWALESMKIADYGLPHISQFKRSEKVTPFLTFGTFNKENNEITYSVKLQKPDGKFAPREYHDLATTRSTLFAMNAYQAQEFATINFDETDTLGIYQFHIIIKDRGNVINSCIMEFQLIE
ncbi:MAG: hypothetical protein FWG07_04540 [Treponema sp.]|nr:hypothetical protein [Treponema sp.]